MTNKELQDKLKEYPEDMKVRIWLEGFWSGIYGVDVSVNGQYINLLDVESD